MIADTENSKAAKVRVQLNPKKHYHFTEEDRHIIEGYKVIVDALGRMFGDTCEVVLHSLEDLDSSVVYIHNGEKTGRRVGSPVTDKALSLINEFKQTGCQNTEIYYSKINQHTIRSISSVIVNSSGAPVGMLCINLDISSPLDLVMKTLLPHDSHFFDDNSSEVFALDSDELIFAKVDRIYDEVMADESISVRNKMRETVNRLYQLGIFNLRDAVNKVASRLEISRDAVYLHLRRIKKEEE